MLRALQVPVLALVSLHGCERLGGTDANPSPSSQSERGADAEGAGWVTLRPGSFAMGSPTSERCRDDDEAPVRVVLTHPMAVATHEVTQRAFRQAMGYNPSFHKSCDECPVDSVTHHEASAYCNSLSADRQLPECYGCSGTEKRTRCESAVDNVISCAGFRLPTEAEWEYAARAGIKTATYAGDIASCMGADESAHGIAWYKANSRGASHPTGQKRPNPWGLFDMLGNVYEWTQDWYAPKRAGGRAPRGPKAGEERVLRGGSWYHNAEHARSGNRYAFRPEKRLSYVGFRCVRTIDAKTAVGGT
jgi:formylglycine-generating enzyme required for sulfatase activity